MFFGGCFCGELGYFTEAGALDLGFRRTEHSDPYSKRVESSAGFLVLVMVLGDEP